MLALASIKYRLSKLSALLEEKKNAIKGGKNKLFLGKKLQLKIFLKGNIARAVFTKKSKISLQEQFH